MEIKVNDNISKNPVKSTNSDIQEKAKIECDNFLKK